MNMSLLNLASKWLSIIVIGTMSLFNAGYVEDEIDVNNENVIKDVSVINKVTNYKTVYQYNPKLPSNVSNVITEGKDEIKQVTNTGEDIQVIQAMENQVIEKGSGAYGVYNGKLTGYGPDCVGCSGTGNLACRTLEGKVFSLVNDGVYYNDSQYGQVRILAAPLKKFPCGTIIQVTKIGKEPFMAIVLDTGAAMNNALAQGYVLMDLAYASERDKTVFGADGLTGNNINFSVQRWGW